MDTSVGTVYLASIVKTYRTYKDMGERAIAQVRSDDDLNLQIGPESNSIAIIVKHLGGNLRSRFRDFLTADGEKPDRNRDAEFENDTTASRAEILQWWQSGWDVALGSIESLKADDLTRTITIRGENLLVVEALNRSVTHAAYHIGQIVYLARHLVSDDWKTLSIPKAKKP
jgi:Protein of unknown function (DUF1572)